MKKTLGLVFALALVIGCSSVKNANIDYAHDFDFSKVETFQYIDIEETNSANQLMHDRIVGLIVKEMTEGGLREVESDPDIYVTYHVTTEDNTVLTTTGYGYGGYGPGWGGWGYGYHGGVGMTSATTTARTYTEGTMIFDAYEAENKNLVWRGMGTVTVKDSPQKQTQQVEQILAKLGDIWDKILENKKK